MFFYKRPKIITIGNAVYVHASESSAHHFYHLRRSHSRQVNHSHRSGTYTSYSHFFHRQCRRSQSAFYKRKISLKILDKSFSRTSHHRFGRWLGYRSFFVFACVYRIRSIAKQQCIAGKQRLHRFAFFLYRADFDRRQKRTYFARFSRLFRCGYYLTQGFGVRKIGVYK